MADQYNWLSLAKVKKYVPLAERLNVSRVARGVERSPETDVGFVEAYEQCRGSRACMDRKPVKASRPNGQTWGQRRSAFIDRHLAAIHARALPLYEDDDRTPTRVHLALIMWAYSPIPAAKL